MSTIEEKLDGAINRGDLTQVKKLIKNGCNVNYTNALNWTPLMSASWVAASDIVEYLLAVGADIYAQNNEGLTALGMVKTIGDNKYGHDDVIRILEDWEKGHPLKPLDSYLDS